MERPRLEKQYPDTNEGWQFRSVPGEGEFGANTWEQDSWKTTGGANVWTMMSADIDFTPELRKEALAVLARYN